MSIRAQRVAQVRQLRAQGLLFREIGERLGISVRTANEYFNDPDGSKVKARKNSYRGTCESCGKPTDGSNGKKNAPRFCSTCVVRQRATTRWSREKVIAKITEWVELYGEVPSAAEWSPAVAEYKSYPDAPAIRQRFEEGDWPFNTTVIRYFGSWRAGIEAAGFRCKPPGAKRKTA